MRKFDTGATRDDEKTKPNFAGFLSPLVIQRYGAYMNKHRLQADGNLRDSDNWKKGFGPNNARVCLESLWRHMLDTWLHLEGYPQQANESLEEALCAVIFNAQAALHGILKDELTDQAFLDQELREKEYAEKNGLLVYEMKHEE